MTAMSGSSAGIRPGAWREVALSDDEYARILTLLGREPSSVELGMFGAMWSEHCGYKHSRPLLRTLPTEAPWVLQGPGENAGAVDLGDGLAVVFKVESHNHPSAVEPREGAATGVGGIVRDIFTMGARPVAILDGLRFGPLDDARNRYLADNVVAGIGGYGNCLGIPNVGGNIAFDSSFNGNPLVNAMCIGIARHDRIASAAASGPGNVIVLIGAETGRDGLHGAAFASVDDPEASHRGVVQVGNPFLEKLLLEACLELLEGDDIVAMQDLGAAGLTSSTVECASRGDVGAEIDVAKVPRRETGMTAYEVMLSESQERMLLVVRPDAIERVTATVEKWSLRASAIGHITDDVRIRVLDGSEVVCDVPASLFTDACPTYDRPFAPRESASAARRLRPEDAADLADQAAVAAALLTLLGSSNLGSRRSIFERYDSTIMTNTIVGPGGDAAVLRVKGTARGIAASLDCNSRYCFLDPRLGAAHAVAEATRNVAMVGGRSLAITNCLNFGNPERPAGTHELKEAVAGMAEACRFLGLPVVSGNVSLYNETAERAIQPTPMVGAVGVLDDVTRHATTRWLPGDIVIDVGGLPTGLGGSEYAATILGVAGGIPPALDLDLERRLQQTLQAMITDGIVRTAHDVSDGGLLVALAEMAIASGIGVRILCGPDADRRDVGWFGEAGSRAIVAVGADDVDALMVRMRAAGLRADRIGMAAGVEIRLPDGSVVSLEQATGVFDHALAFFA